jgi:hypothetical protein
MSPESLLQLRSSNSQRANIDLKDPTQYLRPVETVHIGTWLSATHLLCSSDE